MIKVNVEITNKSLHKKINPKKYFKKKLNKISKNIDFFKKKNFFYYFINQFLSYKKFEQKIQKSK